MNNDSRQSLPKMIANLSTWPKTYSKSMFMNSRRENYLKNISLFLMLFLKKAFKKTKLDNSSTCSKNISIIMETTFTNSNKK